MKPHKIWIEQCEAAKGIEDEFGTQKALAYLIGTKFLLCLEGERACPPEDCGGPWGFADYPEALADPKHEQHDELLEWRGPFNPEAFDAKKATREMRKASCSKLSK